MSKDEALTLALEALYALAAMNHTTQQMKSNAINAIKEALTQEQEPVAWISENAGLYHGKPDKSLNPLPLYLAPPPCPTCEALAQPEQEPVAFICEFYADEGHPFVSFEPVTHGTNTPLYTAPQRTWVGLTDEEKHEIRYSHMTSAEFIEFIEAKLKEKNT